jgi:hypothetical protein
MHPGAGDQHENPFAADAKNLLAQDGNGIQGYVRGVRGRVADCGDRSELVGQLPKQPLPMLWERGADPFLHCLAVLDQGDDRTQRQVRDVCAEIHGPSIDTGRPLRVRRPTQQCPQGWEEERVKLGLHRFRVPYDGSAEVEVRIAAASVSPRTWASCCAHSRPSVSARS